MKRILLIAALTIAAPAAARTHTTAEQQKAIEVCRLMATDADTYKKGLEIIVASTDMSAEDKDYLIDMCASYVGGKLDGLKEAKAILDQN